MSDDPPPVHESHRRQGVTPYAHPPGRILPGDMRTVAAVVELLTDSELTGIAITELMEPVRRSSVSWQKYRGRRSTRGGRTLAAHGGCAGGTPVRGSSRDDDCRAGRRALGPEGQGQRGALWRTLGGGTPEGVIRMRAPAPRRRATRELADWYGIDGARLRLRGASRRSASTKGAISSGWG